MHISEGVLSLPVLAGGAFLAMVGTAIGLRRLDYDRLMSVALLSAAFFVASLIHVPIGPASAHLILNGLLGAILGWASFPAILSGLLLQSVLFQYGGLTALGANTFNMALPAVLCSLSFGPLLRSTGTKQTLGAFACGFCAVLGAGLLTAASLALTGEGFATVAKLILLGHLPIMAVEGVLTTLTVKFLIKIRPELLGMIGRPAPGPHPPGGRTS